MLIIDVRIHGAFGGLVLLFGLSLCHQEYKNHRSGMWEREHPYCFFSSGLLDEVGEILGFLLLIVGFSTFIP